MRRVGLARGGRVANDPWTTFRLRRGRVWLRVIVSVGGGWDHVSVTVGCGGRCPTWEEMCFVREVFFEDGVWVVQFHPPAGENVDEHRFCLHLWRPIGVAMPCPPKGFV